MASSKLEQFKAQQAAQNKGVNTSVDTALASAPPSNDNGLSIFKKAGSLGIPSTIVFGDPYTGKSTVVRDAILKAGLTPLWLSFAATSVLNTPEVSEWSVAEIGSWDTFLTNIVKPATRKELKGFDAVVIDGLQVLQELANAKQAGSGKPERDEYLAAANVAKDAISKLREAFGKLFATVDVVPEMKNGVKVGRKINLNPYFKQNVFPLFGNRWYTNNVRERDEQKQLTGRKLFTLQTDGQDAENFINGNQI